MDWRRGGEGREEAKAGWSGLQGGGGRGEVGGCRLEDKRD